MIFVNLQAKLKLNICEIKYALTSHIKNIILKKRMSKPKCSIIAKSNLKKLIEIVTHPLWLLF